METRKLLSLVVLILMTFSSNIKVRGQESSTRSYSNLINVQDPGTLSTILSLAQKDTITSLKLTGRLDSFVGSRDIDPPNPESYSTKSEKIGDFDVLFQMPNLKYLDISEVEIENNVIPSNAFYKNHTLKKITLPSTIETIKDGAFTYCDSLTEIIFPEGLKEIESSAFQNCISLKDNIVLPKSIEYIGYYAFKGCNSLFNIKLNSDSPFKITDSSFDYRILFNVPKGTAHIYAAAPYWNRRPFIDGGQVSSIEVKLNTPGTLAEEILKKVEHITTLNIIKISGTLNEDDFLQIKNRMYSLLSVDMANAEAESFPEELFKDRGAMYELKLPKSLKTIERYACFGCEGLKNIILPESLTKIDVMSFANCYSLQSINLPDSLSELGAYTFQNCLSLKNIVIPDNIAVIKESTFYGCKSLVSAKLPAYLTEIGSAAFANCTSLLAIEFPKTLLNIKIVAFENCTSLTEVHLPALLQGCYSSFSNCHNLKKFSCLAVAPPKSWGNVIDGIDASKCELYVPFLSVNSYKLSVGWGFFPTIKPYSDEISDIIINGTFILNEDIRPTNNPNVSVMKHGAFKLNGTNSFNIKNYVQEHELASGYNNTDLSIFSSLISESPTMRADSVALKFSATATRWFYITLPFDAKVSDIEVSNGVEFAIRKYSGSNRAITGVGGNWKNMTSDSTLLAGQGYVIQFNNPADKFIVRAINNGNKNKLFSNSAQKITLKDYPSELAHNRSWNFVGNPYMSYFNIKNIEYNAPITIWNGNGYTALSITDDKYVLKPGQAFFVQKPVGTDEIVFNPLGRQIDNKVTYDSSVRNLSDRSIYNFVLSNSNYSDKTRIVVNSKANMGYELEYDAAKFMSTEINVPQIFSTDNKQTQYAINERPLEDGVVSLGVYIGEEGSYTLSLDMDNHNGQDIILVDKHSNREAVISSSEYVFNSSAGLFPDRFEIRLNNSVSSIENASEQNANVYSANGKIFVNAPQGTKITILSVSGQTVKTQTSTQSVSDFEVEQGAYIVKVDKESHKVIVRK